MTKAKTAKPEIVRIEGFILKTEYGGYTFCTSEMADYGYITVRPHTLDFEIPSDFNPVAAEVEMLNKKLSAVNKEFAGKVREIKDRISKLQCIEMSTP